MINFSMWLTDAPNSENEIVRISYKIKSVKRFKAMTAKQKESLIGMIIRFEASLSVVKKELK